MNQQLPLTTLNDPEIKTEVENKLKALQLIEADLPAVLIVHSIPDFSVLYMSQRGLTFLNTTLEEIKLPNEEYHARFFNPEDVPHYLPKLTGLLTRNDSDELVSFFQQVRSSPQHEWIWHLSSSKILLRDKNNNPILTLTIAVPIEAQTHITTKVERLMQENTFLRNNQHLYASLTRREKEILKLMALGTSSADIAAQLHISETTALTHRRNIRNKLNAQSFYDIVYFAQAFNLV